MKISEIMTRKVNSISPEAPVMDGIKALFTNKISGLPVIDASGKIVGMFTEKDVLRNILPSYLAQVGKFVYENSPKTIKCKVERLPEHKVSELMRREVVKVSEDASIYEVAHIMLTQNVRRIPVVDKNDVMVGIVARSDVLDNILKG
ncbi:MAG: CBS domain-containing protein [Candidatus Omnitrophica bacterium]|nr:CBS domain-containing protein [Candidatus Omnitrophota bacterium]